MEEKIPVLDIIFVIDATASMDCMVEFFNKRLVSCVRQINENANSYFRKTKVRVKIVEFRDLDSKEDFLKISPLFDATDYDEIDKYAKAMRASGGKDLIEDGFTALFDALKINDPYDTDEYSYRRHAVLFFSDNETKLPTLDDYPKTVEEFASILKDENNKYGIETKELDIIFFTPKETNYSKLASLVKDTIIMKSYGDIGDGMMGLLWNDPYYIMSFIK